MELRRLYSTLRPTMAALFSIPLLGYALRILVGLLKLPRLNFHLRRLDRETRDDRAHAAALQQSQIEMRRELGQTLHGLQTQHDRITAIETSVAHTLEKVQTLGDTLPNLVESASSAQTAVRMLRRERLRQSDYLRPASEPAHQIWTDPQIDVVAEREFRREAATTWNRMPRLSDWAAGGALAERMTQLREPHLIHRKMWEYAICIEAFAQLGISTPDSVGLAVGAGSERPLYYYANTIKRMVATDLYDNAAHEGTPVMLSSPASFAPFPYREDRLEVMCMGGDALVFDDGIFDFVFCLSSIEHFGSRQTQARAFSEMGRVVRSGGVVCIITELVLNGEKHHEYFTPSEIWETFLQHPTLKLIGPLDMRISDALLPLAVDVRVPSELVVSPHIVLTDGRVLWTSLSMFFRKT